MGTDEVESILLVLGDFVMRASTGNFLIEYVKGDFRRGDEEGEGGGGNGEVLMVGLMCRAQ